MTTTGMNAETPDGTAPSRGAVGTTGPEPAKPAPSGVRPIWFVLAAVVFVLGAVGLVAVATRGGGTREPKTWEYTVPNGTGARIERGEKLYVFPARLDVRVGDQIVIHNDDVRPAEVGPYTVDRNSTLSQTFTSPGYITGFCSIHPSGRVTIHVVD